MEGRDDTDRGRVDGTAASSQREECTADSARHARLILLLAEALRWAEVRGQLHCSDSYIDRGNKRFAAGRLAGLFARHVGREHSR